MDALEKIEIAKRLINSILTEFDLEITVGEDLGDAVLYDKETWHEVPIS
jgi:hypothetical protein